MQKELDNSEKIKEALDLLNHAAKDKKDEFLSLLGGKYDDIRDAVVRSAEQQADWIKDKSKTAMKLEHEAQERVKESLHSVNKSAHANPWAYVGGAAVCGFLLGMLVCRPNGK